MEIPSNLNNESEEIGQSRLVIDEEKLSILKFFYTNRNMDSTKKQNLPVIKECASRVMLTEQQVKVSYFMRIQRPLTAFHQNAISLEQ